MAHVRSLAAVLFARCTGELHRRAMAARRDGESLADLCRVAVTAEVEKREAKRKVRTSD